jgi:hypothetical protein
MRYQPHFLELLINQCNYTDHRQGTFMHVNIRATKIDTEMQKTRLKIQQSIQAVDDLNLEYLHVASNMYLVRI